MEGGSEGGRGGERGGCEGGGVKGVLGEVKKREGWESGEEDVHLCVCVYVYVCVGEQVSKHMFKLICYVKLDLKVHKNHNT